MTPRSRRISSRSRSTSSPLRLSRLPVGSSARSRRAPVASARAIATRCISPPESSYGCARSRRARPTRSSRRRGPRRAASVAAVEPPRQLDVLAHGQVRQQVEELEDHPDVAPPIEDELALRERSTIGAAADADVARRRPVDAADQVEERRLSAPRLSDEREELAGRRLRGPRHRARRRAPPRRRPCEAPGTKRRARRTRPSGGTVREYPMETETGRPQIANDGPRRESSRPTSPHLGASRPGRRPSCAASSPRATAGARSASSGRS